MTDDSGFGSPFEQFFDDLMPQALKFFEDQAFEHGMPPVKGLGPDPFGAAWTRKTEPGPLDSLIPSALADDIRKQVSYIHVPRELLMDAGVIPDTRPPRPPLPWKWRIRNRIGDLRERIAYRAFRAIAGYEVPDVE